MLSVPNSLVTLDYSVGRPLRFFVVMDGSHFLADVDGCCGRFPTFSVPCCFPPCGWISVDDEEAASGVMIHSSYVLSWGFAGVLLEFLLDPLYQQLLVLAGVSLVFNACACLAAFRLDQATLWLFEYSFTGVANYLSIWEELLI
ncbi:hypothetical protein U1Q18_018056 [Sarracenia purpurea var. burkii]